MFKTVNNKNIIFALAFLVFLMFSVSNRNVYGLSIQSIYMNIRNIFKAEDLEEMTNLSGKDRKLYINEISFNNLETSKELISAQTSGIEGQNDDNIEPAVLGQALFYPNPFRQEEGGKLGYRLSKDMEIEIHIYDMFANRIFKTYFPSGSIGGKKGYNKLKLDEETFDNYHLSAGVYFYLLLNKGKVLTKGKMAIIP